MFAPDLPVPLRYLSLGLSVIPLAPKDKRPYSAILDGQTWAPYQNRRPTQDEINGWLARGVEHNWGVVCGQVSGGVYCGDVDDPAFARWVIEHAKDPVFRGACIVETGSHKAHIWFKSSSVVLSGAWRPRGARKLGDIRGDGSGGAGPSYMVVPPSVHPDTGEQYRFRSGKIEDLPTVDNGDAFLADILASYLKANPQGAPPPPQSNNKNILVLDSDERTRIWTHIKTLPLKARIRDTINTPGNQDPNSRHWQRSAGSNSEIDFAVVCELIRKQQSFEQIEQIFAACLIGAACYQNKSRANHGFGYLKTTYDNAWATVEREKQAARVASGTNFRVTRTVCIEYDTDMSTYELTLECTRSDASIFEAQVEVADEDLLTLDRFVKACFKQAKFMPEFANNQQGRHFSLTFGRAISENVSERRVAPEEHTPFGSLAALTRIQLRALKDTGEPESMRHTSGLGWRIGDEYFLRSMKLIMVWKSHEHAFRPTQFDRVFRILGDWEPYRKYWPEGIVEDVVRLRLF